MSDENRTTASQDGLYEQWIAGIKSHDPDVWKDLINVHGADLRKDIRISLQKRDLAAELSDDIEQETWVTALKNIDRFEWQGDEQFYHWLRVISLNHIRKLLREREREASIDDFEDKSNGLELEQFYAKYGLYEQGIEDGMILRERMLSVDYALRQLKPQEAEILLRWLMGEKPRALAVEYGKQVGTISMLLMRAKQKFKVQLEKLETATKRDEHDD